MSTNIVIQEITGNPTAEEETAIRAALEKLVAQLVQIKAPSNSSQWVRYHRTRARSHTRRH